MGLNQLHETNHKQPVNISSYRHEKTSLAVTQATSCRGCHLNQHCREGNSLSGLSGYFGGMTLQPKPLQRGEYLFHQGDTLQYLYVVRSGGVKLLFNSYNGSEQILNFYLRGEILNLSDLESGLHGSSAIALETTSICKLHPGKLHTLCERNPDLYHQLFKMAAREISNEHVKMLLLGQKLAEERLATFILDMADKYRTIGYSFNEFNLPMSRHDIANYLCLADETISRLISKFCDDKLLRVNKRSIRICNYDKLLLKTGAGPQAKINHIC